MRPTDHPEVALFPEERFALAQPRGHVNGDLVEQYGLAMAHHPDWRPGFTEVWDLTFSEAVDFVPSDIGRLKALEEKTLDELKGSRTLIIIDRPLIRITVDFYALLVRPLGREIVAAGSHEEACEILGVDAIPVLT